MRAAITTDGDAFVPLAREVAWARAYLELEQLRFADRLTVTLALDESLDDVLVPALVLQPIVENAIRHGIDVRTGSSLVKISAVGHDNKLCLEVCDSGEEDAVTRATGGAGLGLKTTHARLEHLFGEDYSFALATADGKSKATLEIPLRRVVP